MRDCLFNIEWYFISQWPDIPQMFSYNTQTPKWKEKKIKGKFSVILWRVRHNLFNISSLSNWSTFLQFPLPNYPHSAKIKFRIKKVSFTRNSTQRDRARDLLWAKQASYNIVNIALIQVKYIIYVFINFLSNCVKNVHSSKLFSSDVIFTEYTKTAS